MALASDRMTAETPSNDSTWTLVQPATEPLLLGRGAAAVPHVQARPASRSLRNLSELAARPAEPGKTLAYSPEHPRSAPLETARPMRPRWTRWCHPADRSSSRQAVAAGMLGAVLLLPTLRAGYTLLHNRAAAMGWPSMSLAGLAALSPALREAWRTGQRTMMAAAMGVLSLNWEVTPVSCSTRRSPSGTPAMYEIATSAGAP